MFSSVSSDTLSVVASEHRPFSTKQRALGKEDFTKIPHGVAGVQDRMSVIWERGVVRIHSPLSGLFLINSGFVTPNRDEPLGFRTADATVTFVLC